MDDRDFAAFIRGHKDGDAVELQETHVDAWVTFLRAQGLSMLTMNPSLLNYLADEDAKEMIVLFNPSMGYQKFKDINALVERLDDLGAGEAICDTAIADLRV